MKTESWLIFGACGLSDFYLLWKLHSVGKRIQDSRNSSFVALKEDSNVSLHFDSTQKQLAEKDRLIVHLAENLSALNHARAMIKCLEEENLSLKSFLNAPIVRCEEVTAETANLRNKIQGLKQQCQNAEGKGKDLTAQISYLKWEIEGLKARCTGADRRYENLNLENGTLRKENKELKDRDGPVAKINEKLTAQNSSLLFEIEGLKQRSRNAENQVRHLMTELSFFPENFGEYKRKAEQWKRDLEIVNRRIVAMRKDESE